MKKLIFSVALLSAALSASAEDHPLWMRYPAISPDGTTIAFAYKGDLVKKLNEDVHKMIQQGVATKADGLKVDVKVNEA